MKTTTHHNALLDDPNPRAVIGGNEPPLAEALPVETEALKARAEELIISATERARVTTDDEAERATVLFAMMREHWKEIEAARTTRKAPFLDAGRQIDEYFGVISGPLVGLDPRRKIAGAAGELLARIDAYRQTREAMAMEPVVIRSGYGPKASGRLERTARIVNLRVALTHCLKIDRHKLEEAVLKIYNAQLRAGVHELPGAEIIEAHKTVIRTR